MPEIVYQERRKVPLYLCTTTGREMFKPAAKELGRFWGLEFFGERRGAKFGVAAESSFAVIGFSFESYRCFISSLLPFSRVLLL